MIFHPIHTKVMALLSDQSGLIEVSGMNPDMRTLMANPDRQAAEAVALFVQSIVHRAAALIAEIGGIGRAGLR